MSFLTALLLGLWLGAAYEVFRIPRLLFHVPMPVVSVCDVVYAFCASVCVFVCAFCTSDGQMRLYILVAVAMGVCFYRLTVGRIVTFAVAKIKKKKERE